jgi:FkbM family methyltransferase
MQMIKNFIKSFLVSYKYCPDYIFKLIFNFILLYRKTNNKIYLHDKYIRYKINEYENKIVIRSKYFNFREQAMNVFSYGIKLNGDRISNSYLLNNIKFKENDIVIDCGANTGDILIYFNNLNINIQYIGIEPGKVEYQTLLKNINDDNNYIPLNCALSRNISEKDFYYKPEFGDSSLEIMNNYIDSYKVMTTTFDNIIDTYYPKKIIKLFKLDAEGHEPEIIEGMKDNLKYVQYIAADLGFERGRCQQSTLPDVVNKLLKNNFIIVGVSKDSLRLLFKNLEYHE